ncbi:GNAT family N-acetyltransferase [Massilia sp. H6]|uniref:GNAT family N-acetyltransferase n=1 Tax=Massilia sp. H6 TaxID=2970464 RepID=UPI002169DF15|nr:GNAT family N-acetyltransferase [Massilia sp. H6]UVW29549.1 GNAT family N-acetyltransferase [Massilia sp. H6]
MIINAETPDQPEIRCLLDQLDAVCAALYPVESHHPMNIASLLADDVLFLVARGSDGAALGCVALVRREGFGEVKCMVVDQAMRGRGTGRRLLEQLATFARMSGVRALKLETGIRQLEAIKLYERFGFTRCAPFGAGQPDPLSLFMEKQL